MVKNQTISILGCGWLGLPLAVFLSERGFSVKGSTTNNETFQLLKQLGIAPYLVKINEDAIMAEDLKNFLEAEILIINFPPERRIDIEEYHSKQFKILIEELKSAPVRQVIFVSSTSVYPDLNREVFEDETLAPEKGSGKALKLAEELLRAEEKFTTTVLRFCGLIGEDRVPGRFLAGKKNIDNGNAPVNLIHRDDCIEVIHQIIIQRAWGQVYNACADVHPTRKDFYMEAAKVSQLELPTFNENQKTSFKIINSDKLKTALKFSFKYADPMTLLKETH